MYSRPSRGESEEDLLRFQRDFLCEGTAPAVSHLVKSATSKDDVPNTEDASCEKRPHERDVVQLLGNETTEVFRNPPRKKSKFKERNSSFENPAKHLEIHAEDQVDGPDLLESDDNHVTVVLSKIMEKDTKTCPVAMPTVTPNGFPTVLHRNTLKQSTSVRQAEKTQIDSKKSLFANQFALSGEKNFGIVSTPQAAIGCGGGAVEEDMVEDDIAFFQPSILTGEGLCESSSAQPGDAVAEVLRIHEENIKKISSLSEDEIREEQLKLQEMLDPSIVMFLQEKRKQQMLSNTAGNVSLSVEDDEGIDSYIGDEMMHRNGEEQQGTQNELNVAKDIIGSDFSEKWLNMDQVEHEKLKWMKKPPSVQKSGTNEQARFDFEGDISTENTKVPEYLGLHHHGEEADRAGYTLNELFLLSRSSFLQQRVLAINILAKIIEKV